MQLKYSNPSLARHLTVIAGHDSKIVTILKKALNSYVDPQNESRHGIFKTISKDQSGVEETRTHIYVPGPGGKTGRLIVSITNTSDEQFRDLRKTCDDLTQLCCAMSAEDWNHLTYLDQQILIVSVLPQSLIQQNVLYNKNRLRHAIKRSVDHELHGEALSGSTKSGFDDNFRALHDPPCDSEEGELILGNSGYREEIETLVQSTAQ
ncbi:hypothetical protein IL306_009317 [Fusarium sp. DS 682]|nr:hypothetical protein IL306_009317 [Fusarium sp. DS 682]